MEWMWAVGAVWLLLGVGLALLIGRSIVHADRRAADQAADPPNFVVDRPPLILLPKPPTATGPDATATSSGAARTFSSMHPQGRKALPPRRLDRRAFRLGSVCALVRV